ncbi:MAG: DUF4404 family protein [Methylococcales bacterium]
MREKLNETLENLRSEIENLRTNDNESKAKLEKIVDDLEQKIKNPDDVDHNRLISDVKDTVTHFEVSHPTITAILNDIMMALSNMGI